MPRDNEYTEMILAEVEKRLYTNSPSIEQKKELLHRYSRKPLTANTPNFVFRIDETPETNGILYQTLNYFNEQGIYVTKTIEVELLNSDTSRTEQSIAEFSNIKVVTIYKWSKNNIFKPQLKRELTNLLPKIPVYDIGTLLPLGITLDKLVDISLNALVASAYGIGVHINIDRYAPLLQGMRIGQEGAHSKVYYFGDSDVYSVADGTPDTLADVERNLKKLRKVGIPTSVVKTILWHMKPGDSLDTFITLFKNMRIANNIRIEDWLDAEEIGQLVLANHTDMLHHIYAGVASPNYYINKTRVNTTNFTEIDVTIQIYEKQLDWETVKEIVRLEQKKLARVALQRITQSKLFKDSGLKTCYLKLDSVKWQTKRTIVYSFKLKVEMDDIVVEF